jgi:O-antigen/teichoic acid export membrane protein
LLKFSVRSRFAISFFSNALRGLLSLVTGLLIGRGLGPQSYGDFVFLLGTFVGIKVFLDMGSTHAFYTIMCRKPRGRKFVASYFIWQGLQFLLPLIFIGLLFPEQWIYQIWIGQEKGMILLAFVAVFMKDNAWVTMSNIGESFRLTHKVQIFNLSIVVTHFLLVVVLFWTQHLSLYVLFGLIFIEYLIATCVAFHVLCGNRLKDEEFDGKKVWNEYFNFCAPLILYSWLGFGSLFADRWFLQAFGGSEEQGFYGIGYQLAVVSLLATTSLLRIYWKEIAEAHENNDLERMCKLHQKVCRFLYMAATLVSGFLIPWSEEIVRLFLGSSYLGSVPALSVMFLYPIYQSLGLIGGSFLLAVGKTRPKVVLEGLVIIVAIPVSYFIQAPVDAKLPGLELGSLGMALKMVILCVVSSNLVLWWIARHYGWKFDWVYQVLALAGVLVLGQLSFEGANFLGSMVAMNLFFKGSMALLIYALVVGISLWSVPWVAGLTRNEIKTQFFQTLQFLKKS